MHNIQNGITEDDDITLRYLLRAYSALAATVGADTFAPYVANVLPHLVAEALKKPEVTVGEDQDEEEWETVDVEGKQVAIRTSALEDKLEAVNNLVILTQALGSSLPVTSLHALLEIAVPLLKVCHFSRIERLS